MQSNVFNEYFAKGQFYEVVNGQKKLVPILSFTRTFVAGTSNGVLVAPVTDKKITVISLYVQNHSNSVALGFGLASKPTGTGTYISPNFIIMHNTVPFVLPPSNFGHFETAVSEGLSLVTTGADCSITVRYIQRLN